MRARPLKVRVTTSSFMGYDQESQIRKSYTSKYRNLWDRFLTRLEAGKFSDIHAKYSEIDPDKKNTPATTKTTGVLSQERDG